MVYRLTTTTNFLVGVCWSGTPVDNVSPCGDDASDYYVVVERTTGGTDTCAEFNLELSNGIYDWQ